MVIKFFSLFSGKKKENISNCFLLKFLPSVLSVNKKTEEADWLSHSSYFVTREIDHIWKSQSSTVCKGQSVPVLMVFTVASLNCQLLAKVCAQDNEVLVNCLED